MTTTPTADDSSSLEKALVCLTSFSLSCLALVLAAVVVLPVTASLFASLGVPEGVTQSIAVLELFGLPIIAALVGLHVGVQCVLGAREHA